MDKDTLGRPYAKLDELHEGHIIEFDNGFTCLLAKEAVVQQEGTRKYFICEEGQHFLDGQCDDGVHCIGVYVK